MIPYCSYKGIGVIAYGPLLGGVLARPLSAETTRRSEATKGTPFERKLRDSDIKIVERVEELAKKKGWTMSEVALAWVSAKITGPIVGANKVSVPLSSILLGGRCNGGNVQLERINSIVTTGKTLTEDEIKYLEEPYVIMFSPPIALMLTSKYSYETQPSRW